MFYLTECGAVIILQMEMAGIQLKLQCSICDYEQPTSIHIIHKEFISVGSSDLLSLGFDFQYKSPNSRFAYCVSCVHA